MTSRGALAAVVLVAASPAAAHDYWIASDEHVVASPRTVNASLLAGERLIASEDRTFEAARIGRFVLVHAGVTTDLMPAQREGAQPAFSLPLADNGGNLVVMDRDPVHVEVEPALFAVYVTEEGLGRILEDRVQRGEDRAVAHERYRRNIKALFQVGDTLDDTHATDLGQTLELIPDRNPAFARVGDSLSFQVTFRDKPLAGLTLDALSTTAGATAVIHQQRHISDENGRINVTIDRDARWTVRGVHMLRCTEACDGAEWDSYWTAYSFANSARQPPRATPVSMSVPTHDDGALPVWLLALLGLGGGATLVGLVVVARLAGRRGQDHVP